MTFYRRAAVLSSAIVFITIVLVNQQPVVQNQDNGEIIDGISRYIDDETTHMSDDEILVLARAVYEEAQRYKIDYRLILAMMKVESRFHGSAVSSKGARGFLQVKPSLARYIAEEAGVPWKGSATLHEPKHNVRLGVHFFSGLMDDFANVSLALHAYNMGPNRLKKLIAGRNTTLNKGFSRRVLSEYDAICTILPRA